MTLALYPEIIYEGDLTPDAVGHEVNEAIEVSSSQLFDCAGTMLLKYSEPII